MKSGAHFIKYNGTIVQNSIYGMYTSRKTCFNINMRDVTFTIRFTETLSFY